MSLDTITLEDALKLLSLPRVVGADPESGEEITAQNGRYGPYLKKGTDSRSLTSEDQLLTIGLDEALRIYAQPKQRGRAAAAPPLKELGPDPVSGQPVVVKSGRFGEYVTDGEYNATLRKDDTVEAITLERAAELLAERRERGPAKKATKKAGAKKTAKKSAKKTTKKAAARSPEGRHHTQLKPTRPARRTVQVATRGARGPGRRAPRTSARSRPGRPGAEVHRGREPGRVERHHHLDLGLVRRRRAPKHRAGASGGSRTSSRRRGRRTHRRAAARRG